MVNGEAVTANDIIVTATRTTQKLENVPASIIAVTGQALATAGVTRFQDLALVAPGVQISRSGTYTQPAIRGISTSFAGGGQETNVAVYIDGIYQSDQLGTNQDLLAFTRGKGDVTFLFVFNLTREPAEFTVAGRLKGIAAVPMPGFNAAFDGDVVALDGLDAFCGRI